jgi:hypothetical protein
VRLTCCRPDAIALSVSKRDGKPAVRPRHPPVTVEEWKDLGRSCHQLQAIAGALKQTSWQGAPAVLVNVFQVYEVIAGIYNKAEEARLGPRRKKSTEMPQAASGEASPSESSSEPLKTAQTEAEA